MILYLGPGEYIAIAGVLHKDVLQECESIAEYCGIGARAFEDGMLVAIRREVKELPMRVLYHGFIQP
mgnify:CR=1 FL=1